MFKFISHLPKFCKINLPFFLLFSKSNLCSWPIFFLQFLPQTPFWLQNVLYIYIYVHIYIYTIYILYICYIYISFFSLTGETQKFKIEGRKGLPIFKRNLTRLMSSCCHIKICQHNCFLLIVLILLKMIILNRLENFEIWSRWLTECTGK